MEPINAGRLCVCAFTLLILGGCSAAPAEGNEELGSEGVSSALGARKPVFRPGPMARGRSRGHDGRGRGAGSDRCGSYRSVRLSPDATGWIDASSNSLGIQGQWYSYGDGQGPDGLRDGACQAAGHADAECSVIESPVPGTPGFVNQGGKMCTSGTVSQVLDLNGAPDYGNMFGAGIGFNLANTTIGQPALFDARAQRVIGVQFELDNLPAAGLYVGFATPKSDAGAVGPDYWGANASFQSSPVVVGTNTVLFANVQSPGASTVPIDVTQLESMQFQVRTSTTQSSKFAYCISNVKALLAP
jgi:hypothetical protein